MGLEELGLIQWHRFQPPRSSGRTGCARRAARIARTSSVLSFCALKCAGGADFEFIELLQGAHLGIALRRAIDIR